MEKITVMVTKDAEHEDFARLSVKSFLENLSQQETYHQ